MSATPIPATPPRRGLGIASLVLSLIPVAVLLIFVVLAIVGTVDDDSGWAILGWAIIGVYVVAPLGLVFGGTALGIGIAASVKNRGRGHGIAGAVIGGVIVLFVLSVVGLIFVSAPF